MLAWLLPGPGGSALSALPLLRLALACWMRFWRTLSPSPWLAAPSLPSPLPLQQAAAAAAAAAAAQQELRKALCWAARPLLRSRRLQQLLLRALPLALAPASLWAALSCCAWACWQGEEALTPLRGPWARRQRCRVRRRALCGLALRAMLLRAQRSLLLPSLLSNGRAAAALPWLQHRAPEALWLT